ncbi:MAG: dihydropteroate synthase [Planctomycetota bacterium]
MDPDLLVFNPRVVFDGALPHAVAEALGKAPVAALPHLVGVAVEAIPEDERVLLVKALMAEGLQAVLPPDRRRGDLLVAGDARLLCRLAERVFPGPPCARGVVAAIRAAIEASSSRSRHLAHARGKLVFERRPLVMGVLNVTPDSFSDGGRYLAPEAAVQRGLEMMDEGAAIIDVGGESTRPGATEVSVEQEWGRVAPVLEALAARVEVPISIDTRKAEVARRAVAMGAAIVNDVTCLSDPGMIPVVAASGAAVVISHIRGEPRTMQDHPFYTEVVAEVCSELRKTARAALQGGVGRDRILLDPGIGFGKRLEDNLRILARLRELTSLGFPLMIGCSRKSFLGHILGRPPQERLSGTTATTVLAALSGVDFVRVHDVRPAIEALRVVLAVDEHATLATL